MPAYAEIKAGLGLSAPTQGRTSYRDLKARLAPAWKPNPQPVPNAPGDVLAPGGAPVSAAVATNARPSLFDVSRGTPTIGALPRGQTMTPPKLGIIPRIAETGMAATSGALRGATLGVSQPFLKDIIPDIEDVQARNKFATGAGDFVGSGALIGLGAGAAAAAGGAGASLPIAMGIHKAAAERDPSKFPEGFAEGLALDLGFRGIGKGYSALKGARQTGLAQDALKGVLADAGIPEKAAFPGQFVQPEGAKIAMPPVEPGRQLGKSEAEAFPGLPNLGRTAERTAESSAELPKIQQEFSAASAPHQQGEVKPARQLPPAEGVPVANDLAKTVLDRPLTTEEALRAQQESYQGLRVDVKVPETASGIPQQPWEMTADELDSIYPRAKGVVDGRTVGNKIDNTASIESSIDNATELNGVREVPMSEFSLTGKHYSKAGTERINALAEEIKASGRIDPLIVAIDAEGPYILEGATRAEALHLLGARSFPAKVVLDEGSFYETAKTRISEGKPVPPEVLKDYPDLQAQAAKTILDAPRTPEEIAQQKAGAEATAAFDKSLDVPGPKYKVPEPKNPAVEAQIDAAVKYEALKADREHFAREGMDRPEANKAAEDLAEGKIIGLSKEENAKIRERLKLSGLNEDEARPFLNVIFDVKLAGTDEKALQIAAEIKANPRAITDHEHVAMEMKIGKLSNEYDDLAAEAEKLIDAGDVAAGADARARSEFIMRQIDDLTEAARSGRRETARALGIGRLFMDRENFDLARVIQRAKLAKGSRLTAEETARFQEVVSQLKRTEEENVRLTASHNEVQAALEKANAEKVLARVSKRKTITEKAEAKIANIDARIADTKKQLAALGFRLNDVTGVSVEASYLIGKLAVDYARKGAANLEEVVRLVLNDFPNLTERDVHESLNAKNPKAQSRARSEVEKRVSNLKTQARLLVEIEDAGKGLFAEKGPHWMITAPKEIRDLRSTLSKLRNQAYRSGMAPARLEKALKQIGELQDQLDNQYRALKKKTRPLESEELAAAKDKIKQLRRTMKVEDDMSDLQEQLRTGDFKIPEPRQATKLPPELERNEVELQYLRKKVRTSIEALKPRTKMQQYGEVLNTMRTLVASGDMSAAFRQGFVPSARMLFTDPGALGKIEGQAFKSFFDSYTADSIDAGMRKAPGHYLRVKAGLFLPELGAPPIKGEEMYLSDVAHKFPVVRDIVGASERHMVTLLNLLRAHRFDSFVEKFPNATSEELKAIANWINVSSGRGDLGKYAGALNGLSTVMFAPRFAWSRIQTPYQLARYWGMPRVRKEIAKDLAATVGLGVSVLTAAKLSGLEVGDPLNPDNPDWGKIKVGNTRIDIFAGFQQPARLVARIGKLAGMRAKNIGSRGIGLTQGEGSFEDLLKQEKEEAKTNPLELLGRFTAYKAAPAISLASELFTGKDMVGNKITPLGLAGSHLVPLMLQDVWDAYKDAGISGRTAAVGGLTFFGVGASTYADKKKGGIRHLPTIGKLPRLPAVGAGR